MLITSIATLNLMPVGTPVHHRVHGTYVKQPDGRWKNDRYKTQRIAAKTFARSVYIEVLSTEPW